ncbi:MULTISPECIES: acyl-CoA thioesterase [Actinokineospora]|uniref:Thioesterase n=1 Tax=Actinokineospora fastidiosa TaxID=1816 RepID=A0A918LDZ7_9PSEU|nr:MULTISPECIES: thioesterase family protein [Actinokineospora]UVS80437.1 acyl-CoA thioester hydrolase, YbgC/YbaW family [Actinokineospora sp. UTMC 2448]GGS35307.1 thioesterase [Actinokineospora fastidiosa]
MTELTEHPEYGVVAVLPVHFGDLDAMGQLHNARYINLVEQAGEAVLARVGLGYRDGAITHPDMFAAIRELHISYQFPVRSTGPVAVHLWIESLGTSSLRWGFRVHSVDGAVTHAEGHRTVVKVDPATGRSAPWTDETRAATTGLMREPAASTS